MVFVLQVGDSDQKLAEGISLFSISSDNYGKPLIIGSLVAVCADGFLSAFLILIY